jgi:hypothetical protein
MFDVGRRFWPWLHKISLRICVDFGRARVRRDRIEVALIGAHADRLEDPTSGPAVGDSEAARAIAQLSPRYRRLLLLQALEGWSYRELAVIDGSSVTSVGKVLNRAKERVRRSLGSRGSALGLLPLLRLRIRETLRNAQARLSRWQSALETQGSAAVQGFGAAALGAIVLAAGLVAIQKPAPAPGHAAAERGVVVAGAAATGSQHGRVFEHRTHSRERRVGMAGVVIVETRQPQSGSVDPTGGHSRAEAWGPGGLLLFWNDESHTCLRRGQPTPLPLSVRTC